MIRKEKCIVIDIDGTLCPVKLPEESYDDLCPYPEMLQQLDVYRELGFYIIVATARNMRSYEGNMGLINANTAKKTMAWLDRHGVHYDEIYFGKPWAGAGGFYVDDKAIRPDEFLQLSLEEIQLLIGNK
jgi:capsule biosynthesis phosphatase